MGISKSTTAFTFVAPMCLDTRQPRQHVVYPPSLPLDSPSKAAIRRKLRSTPLERRVESD